jgi:hypothetical protein
MSKLLAKLLDQPEAVVASAVNRLEGLSGYESTDVRLLAEINHRVRGKTAELGLDPDDTTNEELYHGLREKFKVDRSNLDKRLGLDRTSNETEYLEWFMEFVQHANLHPEVWALKRNVAKRLLRDHPPKRSMKQLGYRSLDSMLKREYIGELFAALPAIETERWLNKFWRDLANLKATDFENRPIQVVVMDVERWQTQPQAKLSMQTLPQMGVIAIWPGKNLTRLGAIGLGLDFYEAVGRLKTETSYLKLKQFDSSLGESLLQAVNHQIEPLHELATLPVSWHSICVHFGGLSHQAHANWLPPHVLHEDMHSRKALNILADLDPSLHWWTDLEHVAAHRDGEVVSLNIVDVMEDCLSGRRYHQRRSENLHISLWHELLNRYLYHDGVKMRFLAGLDNQQFAPQIADVRADENYDMLAEIKRSVEV